MQKETRKEGENRFIPTNEEQSVLQMINEYHGRR